MARPRFHALVTLPFAWGAYRRWGVGGAAGVMAAGVFVDLDHLIDYVWLRWRGQRSHYFAPLHGWELAAGLSALALWVPQTAKTGASRPDHVARQQPSPQGMLSQAQVADTVAGLATGLWVHLIQDVLTNAPRHAGVYSLTYRLRHGFRREITGWGEETRFHAWSKLPWYRWF